MTPITPVPGTAEEVERVALRITRGVRRALAALGQASVTEVTLATGRRADILAVDDDGLLTLVEVKSCLADFRSDAKWRDYGPFCDRFYFAVAEGFPLAVLPDDCGLIVTDGYEAAVLREAPLQPLHPSRRKAVTLRFARAAAQRLHRLDDPAL